MLHFSASVDECADLPSCKNAQADGLTPVNSEDNKERKTGRQDGAVWKFVGYRLLKPQLFRQRRQKGQV